jgi:hypothetical protein
MKEIVIPAADPAESFIEPLRTGRAYLRHPALRLVSP